MFRTDCFGGGIEYHRRNKKSKGSEIEMRFKVIRKWEDLGAKWKPGDVITISDSAYQEVQSRIKRFPWADLCEYGYWLIPLSYLERIPDTN